MTKLKAIWKLIWSKNFIVYSLKDFPKATICTKADIYDHETLKRFCEEHIESLEAVEYTKSLLTEI